MLDMRSYRGANAGDVASYGPDAHLLGPTQLAWLKRELVRSRATWKVIAADLPLGVFSHDAIAQGDGPARGRELEIAGLLSFMKHAGVANTIWVTADMHYTAANYYDPNRAVFQDFDPFWEFISGPIHAGTWAPGRLDNTFGPRAVFELGCGKGQQDNLAPCFGLQFFGHVAIDGETEVMTVTLKDVNDRTLWSKQIEPACCAGARLATCRSPWFPREQTEFHSIVPHAATALDDVAALSRNAASLESGQTDQICNLTEVVVRETMTRARAYEESENVGRNPTDSPTIGDVIAERLGRRDILKGALGVAAMAATVSPLALASASRANADSASRFRFDEIEAGIDQTPPRRGGLRRRRADPLGRSGAAGRAGVRSDEADRRRAARAVRLQLRLHRLFPDAGRRQSVAPRPARRQPRIHQRGADVPRPAAGRTSRT